MGKKNINDIRKSITKRKLEKRERLKIPISKSTYVAASVEEEEKHGYFPTSSHIPSGSKEESVVLPAIVFKGLLAGILFFATALFLKLDIDSLEKPQSMLVSALTKEFNFAKVQSWYRDHLGTPFAFLNDKKDNMEHVQKEGLVLPVNGSISQSFQETGEGVLLEVSSEDNMNVSAMEQGTVIFAGNERDTGKTIIIQHEDGSNSIYGNLHEIEVFQYQFVDKNQVIGTVRPEEGKEVAELYFAIKENQTYIDPVKVIQVDEQN
jgi:stage IV sporulation protein FA